MSDCNGEASLMRKPWSTSGFGTMGKKIPKKIFKLIKSCLNEIYNKSRASNYLSDTFPTQNGLKSGTALSPFLFNFIAGYAINKAHAKHKRLKLNGKHQILLAT